MKIQKDTHLQEEDFGGIARKFILSYKKYIYV